MKTVKIDDFIVGGESTYLIADVGSNHKQDIIYGYSSTLARTQRTQAQT